MKPGRSRVGAGYEPAEERAKGHNGIVTLIANVLLSFFLALGTAGTKCSQGSRPLNGPQHTPRSIGNDATLIGTASAYICIKREEWTSFQRFTL